MENAFLLFKLGYYRQGTKHQELKLNASAAALLKEQVLRAKLGRFLASGLSKNRKVSNN